MDNDFGTWQAWSNQYWPAKYLIDREGHVRYYHFGEGEYGKTEEAIRTLLGDSAPAASGLADESPHGLVTPESYLGYKRLDRNGGDDVVQDEPHAYTLPARPARERARLRRHLDRAGRARGGRHEREPAGCSTAPATSSSCSPGRARCEVLVDGKPERTVRVSGDRLYTLVEGEEIRDHLLELRFTPGVAAYAFTFG